MTYRLAVSRRAEQDADVIYDWLMQRSARGASHWFRALSEALQALAENPQRYPRAPEAEIVDRDVRQALFKTRRGRAYRILLTILDDAVHIVAIRGFGQDIATPDELDLPN